MKTERQVRIPAVQRDVANLAASIVIIASIFLAGMPVLEMAKTQDFLNFYTGAVLARQGRFADMHDPSLQRQTQWRIAGPGRQLVPFVRPQFYAVVLSPLASLPHEEAFRAWVAAHALILLLLLGLVWRSMGGEAVLLTALFLHPVVGLLHGQDSGLIALLACLGAHALNRGREFAGGAWWSLLLIKFHLAVGPLAALLAARRWKALAGFTTGSALLMAWNFSLSGWKGTVAYYRLLSDPSSEGLYPGLEKLACLQGLAANVALPVTVTYAAFGLPVLFLTLLAFRRRQWHDKLCLAQGGTAFLMPHVFLYDWCSLLPSLLPAARCEERTWVRRLSILLLSPLTAIGFAGPAAGRVAVLLLLVGWLATIAFEKPAQKSRRREATPERA